jgi:hypothetical protein
MLQKIDENKSYTIDFDRLNACADLLVAYLRRDDRHAYRHRTGAPLALKMKDLFNLLDDIDNADENIQLNAVRTGLVYSALLGVITDVKANNVRNNTLLTEGLAAATAVATAAGTTAAAGIGPVAAAAAVEGIRAVGKIVFGSVTANLKKHETAIQAIANEVILKFNVEVLRAADQGRVGGFMGELAPKDLALFKETLVDVFMLITPAQGVVVKHDAKTAA